nr:hypothetical protein [Actinoplanes durhamensis]
MAALNPPGPTSTGTARGGSGNQVASACGVIPGSSTGTTRRPNERALAISFGTHGEFTVFGLSTAITCEDAVMPASTDGASRSPPLMSRESTQTGIRKSSSRARSSATNGSSAVECEMNTVTDPQCPRGHAPTTTEGGLSDSRQ